MQPKAKRTRQRRVRFYWKNQVKLGRSGFVPLLCLVGIDPLINVLANIVDLLANSGASIICS